MKKVFIAATKQNDGKTTVALGLIFNFKKTFKRIGFIKPVGQRYLEEQGLKIDEDTILIDETLKLCGIKCRRKDMSPVAVERGFTENYILKPNPKEITREIKDAYRRVSSGHDLVIIEGTGHAGVGSVFDHSNSQVARLLGSKVILISSGGIGRPIDEIVLNKTLFEKEGVKLLGVIINKVMPNKFDKINDLVRKGLKRKGVDVLGVIPYDPVLARPTFGQILEETDFEVICGKDFLERSVSKIMVGAMEPHDAIKHIAEDSLLITPGDREDMIMTALGCFRNSDAKKLKIAGIILSGGITPEQPIMHQLIKAEIPVLLSKSNTYDVATSLYDLTVKIRPRDTEKINTVVKLIKDYVDMGKISKEM